MLSGVSLVSGWLSARRTSDRTTPRRAAGTIVLICSDEIKSDARRRSGRMYGLKQTMIREVLLDADVVSGPHATSSQVDSRRDTRLMPA